MSEIWAVLEYSEATLHEQSGELLGETAKIVQDQHASYLLCAILLTTPHAELPETTQLAILGVQRLYILEHPQLTHYATGAYVDTLAWFIQERKPKLVITSATPNGRDWTPRLGARLHIPFVPNCLGIDVHDDAIFALRSLYEGRVYVQTRTALHGHTGLATLTPGARGIPPKQEHTSASLEIVQITPEIKLDHGQERIRRITIQAPSPEEVELDAAERIIAGGRGIGQDGFTTIASFAHHVSAAVGATRVATDLGWIEHARQIGATGKIVHPKLYIACGISGAAQHTSGMSDSQTVIAINPDRNAPIFSLADLGLLGDANQILPLATEIMKANNT